jgi:predicted acylesterase/phospholipase RssA
MFATKSIWKNLKSRVLLLPAYLSRIQASVWVLIVLLALAVTSLAIQGHYGAAAKLMSGLVALALLYRAASAMQRAPVALFSIGVLMLAGAWLHFIGARHLVSDIAAAVFAWVVIAHRLSRSSTGSPLTRLPRHPAVRALAFYGALAWCLGSLFDRIESHFVRPERTPFKSALAAQAKDGSPRIAYALSGGGYRAALFHAGVIEQLTEAGIHPSVISSVSGGSIIAAAVQSGMSPREFVSLVSSGSMNLTRELANVDRVAELIASIPFPGTRAPLVPGLHYSRLTAQSDLINREITHGNTMRRVSEGPQPIAWIIGTTDLLSDSALGITARGLITIGIEPPEQRLTKLATNEWGSMSALEPAGFRPCQLRVPLADFKRELPRASTTRPFLVSDAVAASGAFPVAFNVFDAIEDCGSGGAFDKRRLLADGGLVDNFGIRVLEEAAAPDSRLDDSLRSDIVIASDGSELERIRPYAYPTENDDEHSSGLFSTITDVINTLSSLETGGHYDACLQVGPGCRSPIHHLIFVSVRPFLTEGASIDMSHPLDEGALYRVYQYLDEPDREALANVLARDNLPLRAAILAEWDQCLIPNFDVGCIFDPRALGGFKIRGFQARRRPLRICPRWRIDPQRQRPRIFLR